MPLPQGYLPREGDVLIVHATVKWTVDPGDTDVHVIFGGRYGTVTVGVDEIDGILSRHFEPGEIVRSIGGEAKYEVVAGHEGLVWLKTESGAMTTISAATLELVPMPDPIAFMPHAPAHESPSFLAPTEADVPAKDEEMPF